jgi:predicted polyphosphate/ATP-dependent NAD kinase
MESPSSLLRTLGLIVNPIAGMGGAVALKGTDGASERARWLGAHPQAAKHAATALRILRASAGLSRNADAEHALPHRESSTAILFLVAGTCMGEDVARAAGFDVNVMSTPVSAVTSAADTRVAAEAMLAAGVDLLLFAGGDGTARDVFEVVGERVPILGIPAGVKMHSAVFATSAAHAGEVASRFLGGEKSVAVEAAEVMGRDRDNGERASARLFGFARSPRVPLLTQYAKSTARVDDGRELRAACRYAADLARDDALTILGPGTTLRIVRQHLGFDGTLDGVDLVSRGQPLALDVSESQLLDALSSGSAARIIVSIVGGQGYLFGRGNQQISAAVIRRVGRENIVVVAAKSKLLALPEQCLFVDTAAPDVDALLSGYTHVWTSGHERMVYRVQGGGACARGL